MNSPQCLPATAAGNDDDETVESEQKKLSNKFLQY